jgi:peptidoglycan hydrolase-like protein with peptidoglycan-binding domain
VNFRRACAAAASLLAAACFHARHVGDAGVDRPEGERGGEGRAAGGADREAGASQRETPTRAAPRGGRPAVAATPAGLMNPGSTRRIQEALRAKGYLDDVTGSLDARTSAALRRFQRDSDLAETGAPDRETLRRLGIDANDVYRTAP